MVELGRQYLHLEPDDDLEYLKQGGVIVRVHLPIDRS